MIAPHPGCNVGISEIPVFVPFNNQTNFGMPNFVDVPNLDEEIALINELGGGYFNPKLGALTPKKPSLISRLYDCLTTNISESVNFIPLNRDIGLNSAKDSRSLYLDACTAKPQFEELLRNIAAEVECDVSFGPGNAFAVKKEGSIRRKVSQDMHVENISYEIAVQKISDALRATIIIDDESSYEKIAKILTGEIEKMGGVVKYKNIFSENRSNGYVGVHAKVSFPFSTKKGERRKIVAEIQIHFRSIYDGSSNSRKEQGHRLYEDCRTDLEQSSSFLPDVSSVFSFFTGLMNRGYQCRTPASIVQECAKDTHIVDLCEIADSTAKVCEGNLGIPREQMPQLDKSTKAKFLEKKQADGVHIDSQTVSADQLTPVQSELNREKIDELLDLFAQGIFDPCEKEILTSFANDNGIKYVIDGHHRYAACRLIGGNQKVVAIYESIDKLLAELKQFPGIRMSSLKGALKKH